MKKRAITASRDKNIELCEGVFIKVEVKNLNEWEKATEGIKEFTAEQGQTFKATLQQMPSKKTLSREEIITIIEEVRKEQQTYKPQKIRHGGHFSDMKLQRSGGPLLATTENKIGDLFSFKTFGIRLTPQEDKLLNAVYKLLHDKSENKDAKSEIFYGGNQVATLQPYGDKEAKSITLRLKPAELYKEYLGKNDYSGKEIANIKTILFGMIEKKFLIQYNRKRQVQKNSKIEILTDRIEEYQSLLAIKTYFEGMTDTEIKNIDNGDTYMREQREEIIIALNPLLTDQINSKYVEYPSDINQRTIIASGGALRVTESIIDLRDYILREISNKRYLCSLNEDSLITLLRLNNFAEKGRKKLVQQKLKGAIEVSKKLGLLLSYEVIVGAKEQVKYEFTLNPNFE